ncbi:MAG: extracellular solute-binding protein [Caldilineaceae bacterium]|nr:extracellular solute-binding protein [Caldilineaceae bacterium]
MRKTTTRRNFMKGLAVVGLGAASAQLMAACAPAAAPGAQAPSTTGSTSAPAATDVTLRVQAAPEGGQSVMPTQMGERYTTDSGVNVVIEETIYGEIETKTQTGFISGTLQDLLYGHHRWLFINFLKGIYMPIDDAMAADPLPEYDDMYSSVMAGNSLDGVNFSVPGVVHPGGNIAVMFNRTLLAEKGLPEPQMGWTFSDWTELAKAAADPGAGIFGLGFDGMNSFHYYSNVSRSFGSPDSTDTWVMNEDGTQLQYATPPHEEIAAWYLDLLDSKVAPRKPDYIDNSAYGLFINGFSATHASIVGNVTNALNVVGDKFELDAVLLPVGSEGRQGTCYSGNMHMINSNTAHPEEAYELLKLYSSAEAGVMMVLDGKLQPNGHRGAWTHPDVVAVNRMFGVTDDLLTAGIEKFPMPRNTRFTEANNIFLNEIDRIWEGEVAWAAHAPELQAKVQEVLDLDRPE